MIPNMRMWIISKGKMVKVAKIDYVSEEITKEVQLDSEKKYAFLNKASRELFGEETIQEWRDRGIEVITDEGIGKIVFPFNDTYVMLGSGVTDKNTIEIFQGDKVEHGVVGVGKVVLLQGCLIIEWEESPTPSPLCGFEWDGIQCKHLEIVGHIFEGV